MSPVPLGNDRAYITSVILGTPESLSGTPATISLHKMENTILSIMVKFVIRMLRGLKINALRIVHGWLNHNSKQT